MRLDVNIDDSLVVHQATVDCGGCDSLAVDGLELRWIRDKKPVHAVRRHEGATFTHVPKDAVKITVEGIM